MSSLTPPSLRSGRKRSADWCPASSWCGWPRPASRCPVPIANVSGAYTVTVAECALGMLLALTRRIPLGVRFQAEGRWPGDYAPWAGDDLFGRTMAVVGYGSIGRQI